MHSYLDCRPWLELVRLVESVEVSQIRKLISIMSQWPFRVIACGALTFCRFSSLFTSALLGKNHRNNLISWIRESYQFVCFLFSFCLQLFFLIQVECSRNIYPQTFHSDSNRKPSGNNRYFIHPFLYCIFPFLYLFTLFDIHHKKMLIQSNGNPT